MGVPLRDSRDGTVSWVTRLRPEPIKAEFRRETQVACDMTSSGPGMNNREGDLGLGHI